MNEPSQMNYQLALRGFQCARQQAAMQQLLARFGGDDPSLIPFSEVMRQLHQTGETIDHGSQEIPLDKIVCSVSRYRDFTRSFLPKRRSNQERWAGLRAAMDEMVGLSPIEVYQIEMLVLSRMETPSLISRGIGSETITAYVTEIKTRVPFSAIDDPNELICKASYADFLQ